LKYIIVWFSRINTVLEHLAQDSDIDSDEDDESGLDLSDNWLSVEFRIKFQVLIFVFKALNCMAPRYLSDLIGKKSSP